MTDLKLWTDTGGVLSTETLEAFHPLIHLILDMVMLRHHSVGWLYEYLCIALSVRETVDKTVPCSTQ